MSTLIVDDEERDRTWLKNLLTTSPSLQGELPQPIHEGQDGSQAVELATKHHPKLVFLDIKCPIFRASRLPSRFSSCCPTQA